MTQPTFMELVEGVQEPETAPGREIPEHPTVLIGSIPDKTAPQETKDSSG